jgi:hypothetical protein
MGSRTGHICLDCGDHFTVASGGGFFFDLLHCDACGAGRSISHEDLGDIHLGFVKGLPVPYAVARMRLDQQIKATFQGPVLTRDEYHAAAEATLDRCSCGGRFTYDAPPRCPSCRSLPDRWDADPDAPTLFVD